MFTTQLQRIFLLNIRMVNQGLNLSLNELRLIAGHRNISNYENKSVKDLTKALRRSRNISNYENKFVKDLTKALRGSRPGLGIKKNKLKEILKKIFII